MTDMRKKPGLLLMPIFFLLIGCFSGIGQTIGHIYKNVPDLTEREVVGTRYLFDTSWVKGNVVAADNSILNNDSVLYNFDKITQNLFFTTDRRLVYEVDKKEFKSVTFYRNDSAFVFERVQLINPNDFFQVLAFSPDKYALYKLIHTQFKKANYTSNGISESGNKYDEYIDDVEYYIVLPNKEFRMLNSLKKSAVEKAFSLQPDKEKVEIFFSSHKNARSPENYAENLIKFLNGEAVQ
jgi:hypothetical protein